MDVQRSTSPTSIRTQPEIFIHPPQEEVAEKTPWCFYSPDAETTPTDVVPATIYSSESTPPPFGRSDLGDQVTPAKGSSQRRGMEVAGKENRLPPNAESGNDSVVVEVIKVRKSRMSDEDSERPQIPRSKSFITRAFRSIRGVGKGSTSRKTSGQDIAPSLDHPHPSSFERAPTPTISRRTSMALSQIFAGPKSRSSHDVPAITPFLATSTAHSAPSLNSVHIPRTSEETLDRASSLREEAYDRSPSPCPTTKSTTRKRLSFIGLHRVFSVSKSTTPSDATSSSASTPTATLSSSSETEPATPMTPPYDWMSHGFNDVDPDVTLKAEDTSFEMRLDSLHFDSMSFDANRF